MVEMFVIVENDLYFSVRFGDKKAVSFCDESIAEFGKKLERVPVRFFDSVITG